MYDRKKLNRESKSNRAVIIYFPHILLYYNNSCMYIHNKYYLFMRLIIQRRVIYQSKNAAKSSCKC